MKTICKYEYTFRYGVRRHVWTVIGPRAALHLHINEYTGEMAKTAGGPTGGLEIHYRSPPCYRKDEAPDHEQCGILHGPCWHDGSSSAASDIWIPRWQADPHDHDRMFERLTDHLARCDAEEQAEQAEAAKGGEVRRG